MLNVLRSVQTRVRRHILARALAIAAAVTPTASARVPGDVVVDTSRPLTRVVEAFEQECRCMITYEDVKWNLSQTVPSPRLRNHVTGQPGMIPNGVPFRYSPPPDLARMSEADIARSLSQVMDDYESSQNPGKFRLVQGRFALHVLPSQGAISETSVSMAADGVNATVAVHKVLDEVSRVSGQHLDVWNQPLNVMKKLVHITASNEPAYEVLSRIVSNVDVGLSWRLLYDINMNRYYLDIYRPGVRTITLP